MAFIKKCVSTIVKCVSCGKPGIMVVGGNMYCEECSKTKKVPKKSK